jgi:hypothetical protein
LGARRIGGPAAGAAPHFLAFVWPYKGFCLAVITAERRKAYASRDWTEENSLQNSVVRPTNLVPGREGLLDNLQLMVHSGLQLENHAAIAEGFRFENNVPLTTIGDRVARVQFLDRHRLRDSVCLHPHTVGQFRD